MMIMYAPNGNELYVKLRSRICPLDLMMKYVQFQVKMRLSHEVLKMTVDLSSSVG